MSVATVTTIFSSYFATPSGVERVWNALSPSETGAEEPHSISRVVRPRPLSVFREGGEKVDSPPLEIEYVSEGPRLPTESVASQARCWWREI